MENIQEQMETLQYELNAALSDFAPLLELSGQAPQLEPLNKEEALELLDKLDILLDSNNTECMDWVNKLRSIPGTEALIEQVEAFEFKQAHEILVGIREELRSVL